LPQAEVLRGGGSVKTAQAKAHALEQYRSFNETRKAIRHAQVDANLAALSRKKKLLPKALRKKQTWPKKRPRAGWCAEAALFLDTAGVGYGIRH
jgi:hypothetical protein